MKTRRFRTLSLLVVLLTALVLSSCAVRPIGPRPPRRPPHEAPPPPGHRPPQPGPQRPGKPPKKPKKPKKQKPPTPPKRYDDPRF